MIPLTGITSQETAAWKKVPNNLIGGNVLGLFIRTALKAKSRAELARRAAVTNQLRIDSAAGRQVVGARGVLSPDRTTYRDPLHPVAGLPVLVSVRTQETYSYQADVTKHAVETGAVFSDHVIIQPLQVDLSFEVTNWDDSKPGLALLALEEAFLKREPITLLTQHRQIPDMVMASFSADNTLPSFGALAFRATFQQVRRVQLQAEKYTEEKVKTPPDTLVSWREAATVGGAPTSLPAKMFDQFPVGEIVGVPDTQKLAESAAAGAPPKVDVGTVRMRTFDEEYDWVKEFLWPLPPE